MSPDRRLGLLLLPLRLFAGGTFLYAGLFKLLDPTFLDPTSPTSIVAQLRGFERFSPLGPLISVVGVPFAVPIGLLIALAEIGIGLGALTGLAFRLAALGGLLVSLLFYLTASWAISPYFLGPDLPYAAAWLTLLLVGDGGVLRVADSTWFRRLVPLAPVALLAPPRGGTRHQREAALASLERADPTRRRLLEVGLLAAATVVVGGLGTWFRRAGSAGGVALGDGSTPTPTVSGPGATASPGPTSAPTGTLTPTAATGGTTLTNLKSLQSAGSFTFVDPVSGDPGVLISLPNGKVAAFDAVCTHAGCTVQYVEQYGALLCPCHGAAFDATSGQVLQGPTDTPLATFPINVDPTTGAITLRG
jgi:thiosulfate dehydrogenase [quinone] large subunit